MLTELKRCNSIGNIDGLLFLLSVLEGKDKVSRTEINNRCSRENGIVVNCPGAIAFLAYLKLVDVMDNVIIPTEEMMQLSGKNKEDIINIIIKLCLSNMVEDGIFSQESLGFDTDKGHLSIKRSAFPLEYAAIRNCQRSKKLSTKANIGRAIEAKRRAKSKRIRGRRICS